MLEKTFEWLALLTQPKLFLIALSIFLVGGGLIPALRKKNEVLRRYAPLCVIVLGLALLASPGLLGGLLPPEAYANGGVMADLGRLIKPLAMIALVCFTVKTGGHLDVSEMLNQKKGILKTLIASLLPVFLTASAAGWLYANYFYVGDAHLVLVAFACGLAGSVVALPVLSAILFDLNRMQVYGSIAVGLALFEDMFSWFGITILTSAGAGFWPALFKLSLMIVFFVVSLKIIRPILEKLANKINAETTGGKIILVSLGVAVVVFGTQVTSALGFHALIGGVVAGAIIPKSAFKASEGILKAAETWILPFFFAKAALAANFDASRLEVWLFLAAAVIITLVAKVMPVFFMSKQVLPDMTTEERAVVAIMSLPKGVAELVVAHILYESGVFDATMYSVVVLLAFTTTAMTSPLLLWVMPDSRLQQFLSWRRDQGPKPSAE